MSQGDNSPASELVEFKRRQQEAWRIARAAKAPSILEGFAVTPEPPREPTPEGLPLECSNCSGKGTVPGLLHGSKFECYLCDGTGYDMADPVRVIKYLQDKNAEQEKKLKSFLWRGKQFYALWTEEEIKARRAEVADRHIQEHHSSRFD